MDDHFMISMILILVFKWYHHIIVRSIKLSKNEVTRIRKFRQNVKSVES